MGSAVGGYTVVVEDAGGNFSAYCPELPGCVATGKTMSEVRQHMNEAIEFHLEGFREDGVPVPGCLQ